MITRERLVAYWWYFFGVIAVILFWAGVWEGVAGLPESCRYCPEVWEKLGWLPYLSNPFVSLAIGIVMLLLSRFIFKGSDPIQEAEKAAQKALHQVHTHPQREEFHFKYFDKIKQKHMLVRADKVKKIERGFLVMLEKGKEWFIPVHRVNEILHKGKSYHKL